MPPLPQDHTRLPVDVASAVFDALNLDRQPITVTHCHYCGKTWVDCSATLTEHTHQETT